MSKTEEFNWEGVSAKGFGQEYSDAEKQQMEALYEGTMNTIEEKEVLTGNCSRHHRPRCNHQHWLQVRRVGSFERIPRLA